MDHDGVSHTLCVDETLDIEKVQKVFMKQSKCVYRGQLYDIETKPSFNILKTCLDNGIRDITSTNILLLNSSNTNKNQKIDAELVLKSQLLPPQTFHFCIFKNEFKNVEILASHIYTRAYSIAHSACLFKISFDIYRSILDMQGHKSKINPLSIPVSEYLSEYWAEIPKDEAELLFPDYDHDFDSAIVTYSPKPIISKTGGRKPRHKRKI